MHHHKSQPPDWDIFHSPSVSSPLFINIFLGLGFNHILSPIAVAYGKTLKLYSQWLEKTKLEALVAPVWMESLRIVRGFVTKSLRSSSLKKSSSVLHLWPRSSGSLGSLNKAHRSSKMLGERKHLITFEDFSLSASATQLGAEIRHALICKQFPKRLT